MSDVIVVISSSPPVDPNDDLSVKSLWTSLRDRDRGGYINYEAFRNVLKYLADSGRLHQPRMYAQSRHVIYPYAEAWVTVVHPPAERKEYPALQEAWEHYVATLAITTGKTE